MKLTRVPADTEPTSGEHSKKDWGLLITPLQQKKEFIKCLKTFNKTTFQINNGIPQGASSFFPLYIFSFFFFCLGWGISSLA